MSTSKILLIDDDIEIFHIFKKSLTPAIDLEYAPSTQKALELMSDQDHELFLVDLHLDNENGLDFIKDNSKNGKIDPDKVIIVTGKGKTEDEIEGHGLGIRDYIKKPLNPEVLRAVVDKHLSRVAQASSSLIKEGPFSLDLILNTAKVQRKEKLEDLKLTQKELQLLAFFLKNEDMVFSREELFSKVWGGEVEAFSRTVEMHISSLRKKINPYSSYLKNKRSLGYFFKID